MSNDHLSYVEQVPHLHVVLLPYEMTDLQRLAPRCLSLGNLMRALTPEESAWLLDVVNAVHREGYREGAKAAADSD